MRLRWARQRLRCTGGATRPAYSTVPTYLEVEPQTADGAWTVLVALNTDAMMRVDIEATPA